jgi:hypothetical protein
MRMDVGVSITVDLSLEIFGMVEEKVALSSPFIQISKQSGW